MATPFWMRVIGEAERRDPVTTRITGTVQDITQRKQAEEAPAHARRAPIR